MYKRQEYINESSPLGPIEAGVIEDEEVATCLFESENEIYKRLIKRPSIVIGRRGSGKTAFLMHLQSRDYIDDIAVVIDAASGFENIISTLQKNVGDRYVYPETVARLWDWIIWTSLLKATRERLPCLLYTSPSPRD